MRKHIFLICTSLLLFTQIIFSTNYPFEINTSKVIAVGNVYYVDNQLVTNCLGDYSISSRSCGGTDGTAYKGFADIPSTLLPGDTVNIRGGEFFTGGSNYYNRLYPRNSGTADNYITYQNYNNETVTIKGGNTNLDQGILVMNKHYLQFKGLNLTQEWEGIYIADGSTNIIVDGVNAYENLYGIMAGETTNPVSNITIKNSTSHHNTGHGIYFYSRVYDSTIENNKVYSNKNTTNPGLDFVHGIEVSYDWDKNQVPGPRRITISGNEAYDNEVQGIRTGMVTGILIKDNYTHDNGATGIQLEDITEDAVVENNRSINNALINSGETGIWVDDSINVSVRNNFIEDNSVGIIVTKSSRVIMRNNTIVSNNRGPGTNLWNARGVSVHDNSHDTALSHNTLQDNSGIDSSWSDLNICLTTMYNTPNYYVASTGMHLKNNIISNSNSLSDFGLGCTDYTSDYELFYNSVRPVSIKYFDSFSSLTSYKTNSGKDTHSIEQNPLLNSNYEPQSGSPAIDGGGFITTTVGNGSGNNITLADASFFTDGFGVGEGDTIKIGSNSLARITDINYLNNTIVVNRSLSWNNGDNVSFEYSGLAPDIGAYEYDSPIITTTEPTVITYTTNTSGGGGGGGSTSIKNPITNSKSVILGCENRIIGFSIITGQSCKDNISTEINVSSVLNKYNFGTVTLRRGSVGEPVKELQRFLNKTLNLGLVIDGKLGPKTISIIKQWQKNNGLVADGLVGAKTKIKMNEMANRF